MTQADCREGETWTRGQRVKNDALYALASSALFLTRPCSRSMLRGLGRLLAALAWTVAPRSRRLALENVQRALPELSTDETRSLVRRAYTRLGSELGDVIAMLHRPEVLDCLPFLPGSREELARLTAEGRGVVFASAHLGPWEHVAATLVAEGFPLTVVAREAYDARFTRLYDRLRSRRGVRAIYRGARGSAAALLRTLRRGGVLGIPMDLASRVPSIEVPFLGTPAPTPIGPARLALRTGAYVAVGTAAPLPEGGGVGIEVTAIPCHDLQASPFGERELTARINAELSARVRAMPEAWVWMHPRWPATTV